MQLIFKFMQACRCSKFQSKKHDFYFSNLQVSAVFHNVFIHSKTLMSFSCKREINVSNKSIAVTHENPIFPDGSLFFSPAASSKSSYGHVPKLMGILIKNKQ